MAQASLQQYSENSNFIDSLEGEEWRPSISYPGVMASSLGRILLPQREARMPAGNIRTYTPKPTYGVVTSANKTAKHTYRGLQNRFYGNMKIHRIICEAFHGPRPFEKAVVIHIDEDAHNNAAANLKWGTQKENLNCPGFLAYRRSRTGDNSPSRIGKARKSLNQAGQTAVITEINLGGDQ
jgi:hypothetical protein